MTCGSGSQSRQRTCDGSRQCAGKTSQHRDCPGWPCPGKSKDLMSQIITNPRTEVVAVHLYLSIIKLFLIVPTCMQYSP